MDNYPLAEDLLADLLTGAAVVYATTLDQRTLLEQGTGGPDRETVEAVAYFAWQKAQTAYERWQLIATPENLRRAAEAEHAEGVLRAIHLLLGDVVEHQAAANALVTERQFAEIISNETWNTDGDQPG